MCAGTFCYVATRITLHSDRFRVAAGGASLAAVSVSRRSVNITFLTHYTHHERCWIFFPYAGIYASHITTSCSQGAEFLLVKLKTLIEVIFFLIVLSMRIINIRFVLLTHVCVSYDIISTRFSTVSFIGRFRIFASNDALIPSTGPLTIAALCISKTCSQIYQLGGRGLGSLKNKFGNSTPVSKKHRTSITYNK